VPVLEPVARLDKASELRLTASVGAAIAVMAEQAKRRALEKNISETEVMEICLRQRSECWGVNQGEGTRADLYTYYSKSLEHSDLRANLVAEQPKRKP
jgi:hypothetical protein